MKLAVLLVAAIALGGCASQSAPVSHDHTGHRAASSTSAHEQQMNKMRDMHQKMTAAKTPEARQALMAEHMKVMRDGMSMMGQMKGGHGKSGMPMDSQMMGQRMDMMETMMQMMMDREAARTPVK